MRHTRKYREAIARNLTLQDLKNVIVYDEAKDS